ncbi:helix-turn-helix domain-containing protein [uncultured Ruegeria sp.]|uniref:helix-turn-helix transcriptional regulator n=1 Tax=uncultured Ruegeria sp. TaxID=259304 RepID=UPI00261D5065|nr:helix-turn-helix domain-containing protein [uncultured Ruegeria sp.]
MNAPTKAPNFLVEAIIRLQTEIDAELAVTPEAPSPDQMLDTAQLGALLQFSPRTIEGWRANGRGPKVTKIGDAVRYRYADVIAWIQKQNAPT